MSARRAAAGFTLIELVVSISILAVVATMAFGGYRESVANAERAREQARRLQQVQLAVRTLVADFRMLAPRPVREPVGDGYRPALAGSGGGGEFIVELTRAGWPNTVGLPRGTLQRVGYLLDNGTLVRVNWPVLDATLGYEPVRRELAPRVRSLTLRYMNSARDWVERWPAPDAPGELGFRQRPLAVEIVIEFEDYGVIRRIAEVPG